MTADPAAVEKLVIDCALKSLGEINSEIRHAENASLAAVTVFFALSGIGLTSLVKTYDDLLNRWNFVLLVISIAAVVCQLMSHFSLLRIERCASLTADVWKAVLDRAPRYALDVKHAVSSVMYLQENGTFKPLCFTVRLINTVSKRISYVAPVVLAIDAVYRIYRGG